MQEYTSVPFLRTTTNFVQRIHRINLHYVVEELTSTFLYIIVRHLGIKHFHTVTKIIFGTSVKYVLIVLPDP